MEKLCDGYQHCPTINEEDVCGEERDSSSGERYKTHVPNSYGNTLFVPECMPGIVEQAICEHLSFEVERGVVRTIVVKKGARYDCAQTKGELFVLLSCNKCCQNFSGFGGSKGCFNFYRSNKCALSGKNPALALYTHEGVDKIEQVYLEKFTPPWTFNATYICKATKKCLPISHVCDISNDCGDWEDERNCPSRFLCSNDSEEVVHIAKKCDGVYDCVDKEDECNEDCRGSIPENFEILDSKFFKACAFTIGTFSIMFNTGAIFLYIKSIGTHIGISTFVNDTFVCMIALGDLFVGVYMFTIFLVDNYYKSHDYCRKQQRWLGSLGCDGAGVISTFGTMFSLLCMTALSIFRVVSIKTMLSLADFDARNKLKLFLVVVLLMAISALISVIPTFGSFEDYFVNGLYYENNLLLRYKTHSKMELVDELYNWEFVPPTVYYNSTWTEVKYKVEQIFSVNKYNEHYAIGFYGNHGVCLFKYFVTQDDPQWLYSISVLTLNTACFVVITVCYVLIIRHTSASGASSGITDQRRNTMMKLQRKVTIIIATDFITWIPFTITAFWHFGKPFDASKFYMASSIVILPINGVMNPLIYNGDRIYRIVKEVCLRHCYIHNF